jgi:hypothetical protein
VFEINKETSRPWIEEGREVLFLRLRHARGDAERGADGRQNRYQRLNNKFPDFFLRHSFLWVNYSTKSNRDKDKNLQKSIKNIFVGFCVDFCL